MTGATGTRRRVRRVLFAGLGGIGQRHLRNVRTLLGDAVQVDAFRVRREQVVVDDQLQVAPGPPLEERFGIEVFADLDRALAARPDVVFVTNPSSLHLPVALAAARAGAHVFVEKPLSHSLEGVGELASALDAAHSFGFVAYQLRRHPGFALVRARLRDGSIGRALSVRAEVGEYLPGFHPYEDYRRMYASRRELGGGVTLSQIHELDLLTALFGLPKRVFAMGGKVSALEVDVDDLCSGLLEFVRADGGPLVAELHQDFFQRPPSRRLSVIGEHGRLEWSLSDKSFRRWEASGALVESEDYASLPRNQLFLDELAYFFSCIESGSPPDVDVRRGADSLRLALALLESQTSGRAVTIAEAA